MTWHAFVGVGFKALTGYALLALSPPAGAQTNTDLSGRCELWRHQAMVLYGEGIELLNPTNSAFAASSEVLTLHQERRFLDHLAKWTELWNDMDQWSGSFQPTTLSSALTVAAPRLSASLLEASLVADYAARRHDVPEWKTVARRVWVLYWSAQEVCDSSMKQASDGRALPLTPLRQSARRAISPTEGGYVGLLSRFGGIYGILEAKARDTPAQTLPERWLSEVWPLANRFVEARLSLGASADQHGQPCLEDLTRISNGLTHANGILLCLVHAGKDRRVASLGLECSKIRLADGQAFLECLKMARAERFPGGAGAGAPPAPK
jgi:hypothetical protein